MVWPQKYLHSVVFLLASSRTSLHYLPPIQSAPGIFINRRYCCLHSTTGDTSLALSKLHDELSGYINKHPDATSIIAGDFNKANLRKVMPNFHQHISCPTRGLNTLDHCYTPLKNAYKAHSLPAFGKSDHAAIFLTPEYINGSSRSPGGEGSDALVLPLWSYAIGGSWWRRLGHVPGEFIWRQRIHGG